MKKTSRSFCFSSRVLLRKLLSRKEILSLEFSGELARQLLPLVSYLLRTCAGRLLRHIFDIIDINGNGQISQAELQDHTGQNWVLGVVLPHLPISKKVVRSCLV